MRRLVRWGDKLGGVVAAGCYATQRLLRPVMHVRGPGAEVGCESGEVGGVGGEDAVVEAEGEGHDVGIDDVGGSRSSEQVSHNRSIGTREIVYLHCSEELGEPGLSVAVAPYLGHNRSGGVKQGVLLQGGG